jgi:hypothetical protein
MESNDVRLFAQSVLAFADVVAMKSENDARMMTEFSVAYTEESFNQLESYRKLKMMLESHENGSMTSAVKTGEVYEKYINEPMKFKDMDDEINIPSPMELYVITEYSVANDAHENIGFCLNKHDAEKIISRLTLKREEDGNPLLKEYYHTLVSKLEVE